MITWAVITSPSKFYLTSHSNEIQHLQNHSTDVTNDDDLLHHTLKNSLKSIDTDIIVGSMDQESSQQLKMWFSEHFFAPKLAGLFVTPIVSATSNKFGAKNV